MRAPTGRADERIATGEHRAGALAYTAGDAIGQPLVLRKLLGILKVFEYVDLAILRSGQHAIRLQRGLKLLQLVEHRIDVGDKIALHREAGKRGKLDDTKTGGVACGTR